MPFFTFVWRNIVRRKTRSLLTVVGLGVAVAAVVALVGVTDGIANQYNNLYSKRDVDLVVQKVGGDVELNNGLPDDFGDEIEKQVPHVTAALGGLTDTPSVKFKEHTLEVVFINGWRAGSGLFDNLTLEEGRPLKADDHGKAWVGRLLATNLGLKLHDKIEVYEHPLEVVGIFNSDYVFEQQSIAILLPELQEFTQRKGQVTGYLIRTDIPDKGSERSREELAKVAAGIEKLRPGVAAIPTDVFTHNLNQIKLVQGFAWVTSTIALIIGAIFVLNTMVMSVYERVRDFGTLRAIGWKKIRVIRMIVVESLVLSLAGAILGSVAARGFTWILSKMPQTSGFVSGHIEPAVFAEGFLLALAVGLLGAVYPAYWGATLRPIDAMRRK